MDSFYTYIVYFCCFIGGTICAIVALALAKGNGETVKQVEKPTVAEIAPVKKKAGRPRKTKQGS